MINNRRFVQGLAWAALVLSSCGKTATDTVSSPTIGNAKITLHVKDMTVRLELR
jgi:hypothetical protein